MFNYLIESVLDSHNGHYLGEITIFLTQLNIPFSLMRVI